MRSRTMPQLQEDFGLSARRATPPYRSRPGSTAPRRGCDHLQYKNVNGKQHGTDQGLLRQEAVCHQHWPAALFEQFGHFRFVQLAPEFGFAVFDLRADVFRQFSPDVLLLVLRQPEPNRLQITINEFHERTPLEFLPAKAQCPAIL